MSYFQIIFILLWRGLLIVALSPIAIPLLLPMGILHLLGERMPPQWVDDLIDMLWNLFGK